MVTRLADDVVVADLDAGGLPLVGDVLGLAADDREGVDDVVLSPRVVSPPDADVGDQPRAPADLDVGADHAIGTDLDVVGDLGPGIDAGGVGDHRGHGTWSSGARVL